MNDISIKGMTQGHFIVARYLSDLPPAQIWDKVIL